jgi:hypothetical protein
MLSVIMLSVIKQSANILNVSLLSTNLLSVTIHYAECHFDEYHYAECHYDECHYANSHGTILATISNLSPHPGANAIKSLRFFERNLRFTQTLLILARRKPTMVVHLRLRFNKKYKK